MQQQECLLWFVLTAVLAIGDALDAKGTAAAVAPNLTFVSNAEHIGAHTPGASAIKYGLEGGTVILENGSFYYFASEMRGDPYAVNMSLAVWSGHASNSSQWRRVATLMESSANYNGTDPRAALWAPMPSYDSSTETWYLYYVAYRCAPNNASGWFNNFDGTIWASASKTQGIQGFLGPFDKGDQVLSRDKNAQPWEGLQGTDSISPLFRLSNGDLAAFYGSCHSEHPAPKPYNNGRWNVGLVTTEGFGREFVRQPFPSVNPVDFNHGYAENPVVTMWSPSCVSNVTRNGESPAPVPSVVSTHSSSDSSTQLFLAVYDALDAQDQGFGLGWSQDGLHWSSKVVSVPGGVRTPLKLVVWPDQSSATLFYTRQDTSSTFESMWSANFTLTTTTL